MLAYFWNLQTEIYITGRKLEQIWPDRRGLKTENIQSRKEINILVIDPSQNYFRQPAYPSERCERTEGLKPLSVESRLAEHR